MDLTPSKRPQRRSTLSERLGRYALVTGAVCAIAAIVGEAFFPAELEGDTGGNDFAGLAAMIWVFVAFVVCVVAVASYEAYLRAERRRDKDDNNSN